MSDDLEILRFLERQKFLQRISEQEGVPLEHVAVLDKKYELVQRGQYSPDENEPVPGRMRDIAELVEMTTGLVWHAQQIGCIGRPIVYRDLIVLGGLKTYLEHEGKIVPAKPRTQQDFSPK
jgi:hypothetical protein